MTVDLNQIIERLKSPAKCAICHTACAQCSANPERAALLAIRKEITESSARSSDDYAQLIWEIEAILEANLV